MKKDELLKKLQNSIWKDRYFCRLAVLDHISECLEKDNYLKATDTQKTDIGYQHLEKELMDLKILLDLYFIDNEELHLTRMKKILEKLEK